MRRHPLLCLVALLFALPVWAGEPASQERWPQYLEWEAARIASLPPLARALLRRDEDEALRLIEAGASLDDTVSELEVRRLAEPRVKVAYVGGEPEKGYPLVVLAAVADLPRVVEAMGRRSVDRVRALDPNGYSALAWAARQGCDATVKTLLAFGLDPLAAGTDNYTPLSLAVRKKQPGSVALLIRAIPTARYSDIAVAEHVWLAAYFNDTPTLRALLEAGVPPNYVSPQGNTALIASVVDSRLEAVRLLLTHGARADTHLYRGRDIRRIAQDNLKEGRQDAREILTLIEAALPRRPDAAPGIPEPTPRPGRIFDRLRHFDELSMLAGCRQPLA